ncbi:MAG: hypothetical protein HY735_01790 [Verrucomicrobia bacterium]|nr:hypothetical protein [Verrucomicrobiota bacterium]
MNLTGHKLSDVRHPERLFVVVNECLFATLPVRPRYMRLAQARVPQNRNYVIRLKRKGVPPC